MKGKSVASEIVDLRESIVKDIDYWKTIRANGCNDPFWTDGVNMNLARNHVIYHKYKLREICEAIGADIPEEYYLPTPPEVSDNFMANLRQKNRVTKLRRGGWKLCREAPKYDPKQMSFL